MRLVTNGPDIPSNLVAAQERGEALFVCGAGVSVGAGLPLFRDLVERVYANLGEDWCLHPAERDAMETGQFDRALRSLERRLAAADRPRSQGMRERIRAAVHEALAPAPGADLGNHLALLELSRDAESRVRLTTTNFDTLFEQAWHRATGQRLDSQACQAMPRPRAASFRGALHLHGRLGDSELGLEETELVLTSAEFGDAYLRNGWASRYVYDLARTHVLVLVGYQAEDPPMRYLLEALEADRERYPDLKPVFAFAGVEEGRERLQEALWRAKGIHPVLYRTEKGDGHARLYATLRAWVRYAEDPTAWRRERLTALLAGDPAGVGKRELDEAVSLLGHGDAERILGELAPAPAWLPVLSGQRVFADGRASPGPWIANRLTDPEMIRACAAAPPVGEQTWWFVGRAVEDKAAALPMEHRKAWRLIRRAAQVRTFASHHPWYAVRGRAVAGDVDYEVREAVARSFRPHLRVRSPNLPPGLPSPEGGPTPVRSLVHADFGPAKHPPAAREVLDVWPQEARAEAALLRTLCRALEEALEEAEDAGFLDGLDRTSFDVPSVADHPQNQHRYGFMPIVRLVADLWARLALGALAEARAFAAAWGASRFLLLRRLHLHAVAEPAVFGADEAAVVLRGLDDADFWSDDFRRESMRLMAERWTSFRGADREGLEVRIRAGMPRALFPEGAFGDEAQWESIRDYTAFIRLARIDAASGKLSSEGQVALADLRGRHPAWVPGLGDRDDFRSWSSITQGPQGDPSSLAGISDADLVGAAMRLQAERYFEQGDVWRIFCESDPERALRGLEAEADAGRWEPSAWQDLLWAAAIDPAWVILSYAA